MFTDLRRMIKVTDSILVGGGGDYSDFQQVQTLIEEVVRDERLAGGEVMSAPELHSFLGRVFYNRRNRMDPYWNSILVAGFKDGVSYVARLIGSLVRVSVWVWEPDVWVRGPPSLSVMRAHTRQLRSLHPCSLPT
jgi:20S proteasome alpha/beta subunit